MSRHRRPILAPAVPGPERRNFLKRLLAVVAGGALFAGAKQAFAEPQEPTAQNQYIGEIMIVAWGSPAVAPSGWLECDGQELDVLTYMALFSLIGTTYGGNGITTFALPDLRGRLAMHEGQGPGLSNRSLGATGGQESVALGAAQMPAHDHARSANTAVGTANDPTGAHPASDPAGTPHYTAGTNAQMAPTGSSGSGQGHENMPPFTAVRYYIATTGIFPSSEPQQ